MPQTCEVLSRPKDFVFRAADGDVGDFEGEFHRLLLALSGGSCGYEFDENGLSVCISQNSVFIATFRPTEVSECLNSNTLHSGEGDMRDACTSGSASGDYDANVVLQSFGDSILAAPRIPLMVETLDGDGLALLNPSQSTEFVFRVEGGPSLEDTEGIDTGVRGRTEPISSMLRFERIRSEIFEGNLRVVDSSLPEILAVMMLFMYDTGTSDVPTLVDHLDRTNPLGYQGPHDFYRTKVKRLLLECFMGLVPDEAWNGIATAHGGCVIMDDDGSVSCFTTADRSRLENLLYHHARLVIGDVPGHGAFESDYDRSLYTLNLGIRLSI